MEKYIKKTGKENSMSKFVQDLTQKDSLPLKSFNYDTYTQIGKTIEPNLTKLSLSERKRSASKIMAPPPATSKFKKVESTKETQKFTYMPIPKNITITKIYSTNNITTTPTNKDEVPSTSANKTKLGRNMCLVTGRVEFVMKIHKKYPDISAIYEVYGKIIKNVKGKYPSEQLIFLRGATGPVLQSIYYEIDAKMPLLQNGNHVCCIGRFNTSNKLHIFKLTPLAYHPMDEVVSRLQNVCSFTLNKMKKNQ